MKASGQGSSPVLLGYAVTRARTSKLHQNTQQSTCERDAGMTITQAVMP
jgi:hypothetical protein